MFDQMHEWVKTIICPVLIVNRNLNEVNKVFNIKKKIICPGTNLKTNTPKFTIHKNTLHTF